MVKLGDCTLKKGSTYKILPESDLKFDPMMNKLYLDKLNSSLDLNFMQWRENENGVFYKV